jgi:3-dehydroquinate synthase class II
VVLGALLLQVMVEAQLSDGSMVSCMLQNAETVKVAGKLSSSSAAEAHHEQSQPSSHNVQHMALHGSHAISVAVLQPGDQILVHVPKEAARHTGISVKEFVKEV